MEEHVDQSGRYIILKVKINDEVVVLTNCYLPTKDHEKEQIAVLDSITSALANFSEYSLIVGGDFNITLNPALEKSNFIENNISESKTFRASLKGFLMTFHLEDLMRNFQPKQKLYTWHNKTKSISTRLDYFFISDHLVNRVLKCSISTAPYTDHDKVLFTLQSESQPRGPGFWKFNTSFLRNIDYVNTIKATIKESFNAVKEYDDKGLIWDFVKMKIRSNSIVFAKKTKREENQLENMYTSELSKLNCHLAENHSPAIHVKLMS